MATPSIQQTVVANPNSQPTEAANSQKLTISPTTQTNVTDVTPKTGSAVSASQGSKLVVVVLAVGAALAAIVKA